MISTKCRYALRVMIDLARQPRGAYVPLKDIADRQGISKKYLEILMRDLVAGKLVRGVSGKGGGYCLCRLPEEYSVGEILEAMEGSLAAIACLKDGASPCLRADRCDTLPFWKEYHQLTHDFLYGKKLSDLVSPAGPPAENA